jgi:hypothetical protein
MAVRFFYAIMAVAFGDVKIKPEVIRLRLESSFSMQVSATPFDITVAASEDIQVIGLGDISCTQLYEQSLQQKEIDMPKQDYQDYQITYLQFQILSSNPTQSFAITIPYANRLSALEAKHTLVCRYDKTKDKWIPLTATIDQEKKEIHTTMNGMGVFAVFYNRYWYSSFMNNIKAEFPHWTELRTNDSSLGQQFMNYFAIKIEEIDEYLKWILKQKHINHVETDMLDWIYVYEIPEIKSDDTLTLYDGKRKIPILSTLREFFYNTRNDGGIIDYANRRFYSVKKYDSFNGTIVRGTESFSFTAAPIDHHLWNTFDEFGLLVRVRRLHLEKNADYKERILDAFRYPANSGKVGLNNGIARELDMIKRIEWKDDSKSLVIRNKKGYVIPEESLRVDNQPLAPQEYYIDEGGNIIVYARQQGIPHIVSFIWGIEKHELYDKSDLDLHQLMFKADGQATPRMLHWVEYINQIAPIMWDRFNWDEGYWDTIDKQATGLGFVPNIWDSDIDVWKKYRFDAKRWESESIWKTM